MIDLKYPEGATPINPDEAEGLLLTHITTEGELNRWEQDNIVEALAWIDRTKPTNILNEQFVKQLHKRMFGNVWKWAGKFRGLIRTLVCHGIRCRYVSKTCVMMYPYGYKLKMNLPKKWQYVFTIGWCGFILFLMVTAATHASWQISF